MSGTAIGSAHHPQSIWGMLGMDAASLSTFVPPEPMPPVWPAALSASLDRLTRTETLPAASSCVLESLVEAARLLTPRRGAMLDLLLAPVSRPSDDIGRLLRPVWTNEAFERAWLMAELLLTLDERALGGRFPPPGIWQERQTTLRLAAHFRAVNELSGRQLCTQADLLRDILRDAVELFGPAVGDVTLKLHVERLRLPELHWRAVILAALSLLLRACFRGYPTRSAATLAVSLHRADPRTARLTVTDDGCGPTAARIADETNVLDDLSLILDSGIAYRHADCGGLVAEIDVPLADYRRARHAERASCVTR